MIIGSPVIYAGLLAENLVYMLNYNEDNKHYSPKHVNSAIKM